MIKKIPSIIYLWVGQGISSLGSSVYTIALAWYVIEITNSPLKMGTLLFIALIPKIVFSLVSGVIGDRVSKKSFILTIDLIRFLIGLLWGCSLFFREANLYEIYIFTFLFSVLEAFFNPVYSALIPELITEKNKLKLTQAASINQMVFRISMILSPAIGGILISYITFAEFVLLNSLCFLIAAISTMLIKEKVEKKPIEVKNSLVKDLKLGISYFLGDKIIFWSVFLITLANIAVVSYNVNLVNLIQSEMKWNSSFYGITLTSYSVGSFVSLLFLSIIKINKHRGKMYIASLLFGGLLFYLVKISLTPLLIIFIFFLNCKYHFYYYLI